MKPIYELYINARGCFFEVLINDIPVYFYYNIGSTAFRLPVNNFITQSGKQSIKFNMYSVAGDVPFPDGALLELKIDRYQKGDAKERTTVYAYQTPDLAEKKLHLYSDTALFVCEVPYTLSSFSGSVNLIELEKDMLIRELEAQFRTYTNAFKNNDLALYKELTRDRQENMFRSMYISAEEQQRYENGYLSGVAAEGVRFYPIENYQLAFYGNGRLVGLQKVQEAPGVFIDNDEEEQSFIEYVLFHKRNEKSPLRAIV